MKYSERILILVLAILVFLTVFSISYYAIRTSTDEFWHIKTGEYIVQHGYHLPEKDIFTYTASDMDWVNHEWLTQILFYHIYNLSGFKGFVFFKSILIVLTFLMVYAVVYQRTRNHYLALFATLLGALTSRHTLYPRPYIFSYLLVPIYLYFLYEMSKTGIKKIHYWIFPIIMIFWVNLHGGAILGLILLFFFIAGHLLQMAWHFYKKEQKSDELLILKGMVIIFFLTLAASLLNPWGYRIFELTSKVMTDKRLVASIGELLPPDFRFTTYYLAMLIITGLAVLPTLRRIFLPDLFLLLFFGQQSLFHVRHLPLYGITAASVMGIHLVYFKEMVSGYIAKTKQVVDLDKLVKIICTIAILFLVFHISIINQQIWFNLEMIDGPGFRVRDYPVQASNFILMNDFKGNFFNEINSSGYLMFRLYPKHKLFTDNRFDIFGSKFLPDFYEVTEIGPRWKEVLTKYKVNFILTEQTSKLRQALDQSPDWVGVYLDPGYAIFVKNTPENKDLIQNSQNSARRLGLPYQ